MGVRFHFSDGTEMLLSGRTAEPEGTFDIYRMKLGAEDPELELIVPDGIFPLWSPDGGHFIFTAFRNENMELFVADRNGQNLRNLIQHEKYDGRGTWSPDGDRIAYECDRFGNIDICVVDVASGDVVRLTDNPEKIENRPGPVTERSPSPPTGMASSASTAWLRMERRW